MGSPCNGNGEYNNYQKNNRMDAIKNKTNRETQVKVFNFVLPCIIV